MPPKPEVEDAALVLEPLGPRLARGAPRDSGQVWINWVIADGGTPAGYVHATVSR